jgi:hypothetical protein
VAISSPGEITGMIVVVPRGDLPCTWLSDM